MPSFPGSNHYIIIRPTAGAQGAAVQREAALTAAEDEGRTALPGVASKQGCPGAEEEGGPTEDDWQEEG